RDLAVVVDLAEAEKTQDGDHDDNQAYDVDDAVHDPGSALFPRRTRLIRAGFQAKAALEREPAVTKLLPREPLLPARELRQAERPLHPGVFLVSRYGFPRLRRAAVCPRNGGSVMTRSDRMKRRLTQIGVALALAVSTAAIAAPAGARDYYRHHHNNG